MVRCTAPVCGHRTESGRANCPVCVGGGSYRVTTLISHILHHTLHYQAALQVVAVLADKQGQKHVGHQLVLLFYILLLKSEHSLLCVKMLRSARNYLIYEMFFFVSHGMIVKVQLKNYTIYLNQKVQLFGLVIRVSL